MLDLQFGGCGICGTDTPAADRWCIDHCHVTGTIRGILCIKCNMMLGLAKENLMVLQSAIWYLQRFQKKPTSSSVAPPVSSRVDSAG